MVALHSTGLVAGIAQRWCLAWIVVLAQPARTDVDVNMCSRMCCLGLQVKQLWLDDFLHCSRYRMHNRECLCVIAGLGSSQQLQLRALADSFHFTNVAVSKS